MLQEGHIYRGKLVLPESEGLCSVAATTGRRFVVGSACGDVHLFEARAYGEDNDDNNNINGHKIVEQLTRASEPLLHHELGVRDLAIGGLKRDIGACTSLDGGLSVFQLASGSNSSNNEEDIEEKADTTITTTTKSAVESVPGEAMAVAVCGTLNTAIAVGGNGTIRMVDALNAMVTNTINAPAENGKKVAPIGYAVDISGDDEHCVVGFDDGAISLVDMNEMKIIWSNRNIHKGSVKCIRFGNNNEILSSGNDQLIAISDMRTNSNKAEVRGHTGPITGADWNHYGTLFATTSTDQTVRIWDRRLMKMCFRSRGDHRDAALDIAYLADQSGIISCAEDGSLVLHDQID